MSQPTGSLTPWPKLIKLARKACCLLASAREGQLYFPRDLFLPHLFDYTHFVDDLKRRTDGARLSAARAVNRELVALYWDIGRAIREQQARRGWGDAVVDRLACDLKASFPGTTGFSAASLWRMRQFHETCTEPEFLAQLVREKR